MATGKVTGYVPSSIGRMTVADTRPALLAQAEALHSRVVLDPSRYTAQISNLVTAAKQIGDHEALIVGLRAQAWAQHAVLDNTGAKSLLDKAVRLAERHGLDGRLGDALVTRAVALHELGRFAAANRDLQRAAPLVAADQRPELVMQQALLHHNAGRVASAVALYHRVLDDAACPPVIWVKAANNLSYAQTELGRPGEALQYLQRAANLARDLGPVLVACITNSRAWSSFHAGLIADSLRYFEQAGRLHAAAGVPLGEHYLDYADALVDLRLLDEAMAAARSAAVEFDRHEAPLMAAEARLRCARLALALGGVESAQRDAESAAHDFRRQQRTAWFARATVAAVEAGVAAAGYTPEALRRLRRAAASLQRLGLCANAVDAHLAAGRAALALRRKPLARFHLAAAADLAADQSLLVRLRGRLARALLSSAEQAAADALRHCYAGLKDLARHRAALPSVELRVLAAVHGAELGQLGLRSLAPTAPAGRVFRWLERTRAASLLAVQPPVAEVEGDLVALRSIEHSLRASRRERGAEPRELLARRRELEARIRRRSWSRASTAGEAHGIVSAAELRRALRGEWLAEFAVIDDRILAVVVDPRRTTVVEVGSLRAVERETDAVLFALRRLLRGGRFVSEARSSARHALAALSALLLAPLGVPADVPLVVVPAGPLLRVPWSPLRNGPLSVAPSATLWARGRAGAGAAPPSGRDRTPGEPPRVAVAAGPGLPGAIDEVAALRAIYPQARVLLPPDSTVEATVALVQDADVAHLACHGRLRWDNPLFSALDLSDGPLTLYEMVARGVAPRRIVLAACDSGAEKSYAGDEVLGFVSTMMAHGAAGVVASIVGLPDGACALAMSALHEGISRGDSLAVALHRARSTVEVDSAAAFVAWCGLTAYGAG